MPLYILIGLAIHLVCPIVCALLQALTTSVAFWYGLEAFKLRAEVVQDDIQVSNTHWSHSNAMSRAMRVNPSGIGYNLVY